jgi:hypothetical protein
MGAIPMFSADDIRGLYSSNSGFDLGFLVDFIEKRHSGDRSGLHHLM